MEGESRSTSHNQSVNIKTTNTFKKKSFRQLFNREELWYYGIAGLIYIGLGLLVQNWVLNLGIGILFILVWMWITPLIVAKLRAKGPQYLFYTIFKRSNFLYKGNPNKSMLSTDVELRQKQLEGETCNSIINPSTDDYAGKVEED